MSDRPTTRSWNHRPLLVAVETGKDTNVFVRDPRLAVASCVIGSDDRISEAVINCWAGPTTPSAGGESALSAADVFDAKYRSLIGGPFVGPDQRLYVYRERDLEDGQDDAYPIDPIFQGFAKQIRYIESGGGAQLTRSFVLPVEGTLAHLAELYNAQIVGRMMRSNDSADALADEDPTPEVFGTQDDARWLTGIPAVFNPGRGNRAAVDITVTRGSRSVISSLFAHDKDDSAEYWTWAQVWRYLVVWYLMQYEDGTGIVMDGNVLDETDDLQDQDTSDQPTPPVAAADALQYAMLGRPSGFSVEGMNVVEAMVAAAAEMGIHFRVATEIAATGGTADLPAPQDKLYVWPRGSGQVIELHRTNLPGYTAARTVLEKNDVRDMEIGIDARDVVPKPFVVGDVRRYEITQELIPGWEPDAKLDDVANLESAVAYAEAHLDLTGDELLADEWFSRYHRAGGEHHKYRDVGRRWVMNASGRYTAADYARTGGPYQAAMYDPPWDPADCEITDTRIAADGSVETVAVSRGGWTRRPRPFLPCFSASPDKRSLGIVVDLTFDDGSTWHRNVPGLSVRALADEDGIVIETDDLTKLFPPDHEDDGTIDGSFWHAILANTAGVRVTCVIEGNYRIEAVLDPKNWSPPVATDVTRLFDLSGTMKSNRRDGGNSIFKSGGEAETTHQTLDCRDDLADLQLRAQEILSQCATRQVPGLIYVPWISTDYHPGQSVRSIEGLGLTFATQSLAEQTRWPDIVGVEYLPGGMRLVIEDFRVLDRMGRRQSAEPVVMEDA